MTKHDENINNDLLCDLVNANRTWKDSLASMAEQIEGVSQPTLSRLLRGEGRVTTRSAKALCDWLGRPIEDVQIEREGRNITDHVTAKELAFRFERLAGLLNSERISHSKFRELIRDELDLMSSDHYFLKKISPF